MRNLELDFSDQIEEKLFGSEEEVSDESWASEKNKGKKLNKPFRTKGGPKKFSVYVKNDKGNVVKVNFGDPNMEIKRDDPKEEKALGLVIIAMILAQNGKLDTGLVKCGNLKNL